MLQKYQMEMPAGNETSVSFDPRRYYEIFKRRFLFFAIPFVVLLGGGLFVVVALPPVYVAEGRVLVESQQIPTDLVRPTVTTIALERIQVLEQRIKTRENLFAVIEKFQLYRDHKRWLSTTDLIDLIKEKIQIRPLELKSSGLRNNRMTIAFTIGFEHNQPEIAARVANELITMILSEDVRGRTSQATETTRFLTRETARLEGELRSVEAKISEFKQRNSSALPERMPLQVSALAAAEKNFFELNNAIKQLEYEKQMLEAGSYLPMSTKNMDELNKQLSSLRWELLQKSSLYSESHPNIKAVKLQIAAVEREIAGVTSDAAPTRSAQPRDSSNKGKTAEASPPVNVQAIAAIESRLRHATDQRASAEKTLAELRGNIAKASEIEMGLHTLERQQTAVQRDLEETGRKLSAARLGESLERDQRAERFEVIENPTVPQSPSKPNRLLVLALAIGLAFASGVGSVFTAEMIDKSIRSRDELNRIVDSHLVVAIPYVATRSEVSKRRGKTVLIAGGALTIIVGLVAVYVLIPSIGTMIRSFFASILG